MRLASIAGVAGLLAIAASQGIVYNSPFCRNFGVSTATTEWQNKYKTMVANLNKDSTLKAQQTRAANFLNNNWKNLPGILKEFLKSEVDTAKSNLAVRWRVVTYLKGLLAKIKPKLAAAKFNEIKNLLWAKDKEKLHYMVYVYDDWKDEALAKIPAAAKKTEITKVFDDYEKANPSFEQDKTSFNPFKGFNRCNMA